MSFDQNGAIKLCPFDQKWKGEMHPHRARKRRFDLIHPLDLNLMIAISR